MDFETKYWHLVHFQLAKRLTRDEMKYLCTTMEMKYYKKGSETQLGKKKIDKDVYFLKSGTIKIVNYSSDGDEVIKYIIKRGDVFGLMGLMDLENEDDYAITMEDSVICIIDSKYFKKMMEENQKLNNYIFKLTGIRIKKLERSLTSLIYMDAKTRIKNFIMDYVEDLGEEKEDFIIAKNLLSNSDIGKLTSTSRQTVNKILNSLKQNNIIDFDKNIIRINKNVMLNNLSN